MDILHVSKSNSYDHRISGYTNVSAIAALIKPILKTDLVISFGTSGAFCQNGAKIGDIVVGNKFFFID